MFEKPRLPEISNGIDLNEWGKIMKKGKEIKKRMVIKSKDMKRACAPPYQDGIISFHY